MNEISNREEARIVTPVKSHTISVVVPLYNEQENLEMLYQELVSVLKTLPYHYEVIFVNDGSADKSQMVLEFLYFYDDNHVKVVTFAKNAGKAAALREGFAIAMGDIIITLDADLQDDPHEIPRFIEKIDEGYDLVSGWKKDRKDNFIKNKTSKIYNAATSITSGIFLHDHNCGFKAYRREVALSLELKGQLHRFIPLLSASNGFRKISEIPVNHRKRYQGTTKYGLSRFVHGAVGLFYALVITDPLFKKFSSLSRKMIKRPEPYNVKSILA